MNDPLCISEETMEMENLLLTGRCPKTVDEAGKWGVPSDKWTDKQNDSLCDYIDYLYKERAFVIECWKRGPSMESYPIKPDIDIIQLVKKSTGKKDQRKSVEMSKKSDKRNDKRVTKANISKMSDLEFNVYLKSKLNVNAGILKTSDTMNLANLRDVGIFLKAKMVGLQNKDAMNLRDHIEFGSYLIAAKERFDIQKRETKMTWATWVKESVGISEAYARQHREISVLAVKYPKLKQLTMTYTELFKLKKKIQCAFVKNCDIATWWMEG